MGVSLLKDQLEVSNVYAHSTPFQPERKGEIKRLRYGDGDRQKLRKSFPAVRVGAFIVRCCGRNRRQSFFLSGGGCSSEISDCTPRSLRAEASRPALFPRRKMGRNTQ